jgi:hypothetical protein
MLHLVFFAIRLRRSELGFLAMGRTTILLVRQAPQHSDFFTTQEAKH